jgi:hypothetical protein
VAPTGDLVVLDLLEHRLDPIQLRAVGRQEVQEGPLPGQLLPLRLDHLADVQPGVIPHHDARYPGRGQAPEALQQVLGGQRPLERRDLLAEQAIRFVVIDRRITQGTRGSGVIGGVSGSGR